MISTYAPRQSYTGNGAVSAYTFNFKILSLDQLLVVVMNNLGVQVGQYRGSDTSFLSNVVFDTDLGGGTVNLLAVLPAGYKIVLLEADDAPVQPQRWRNRSDFTLSLIENMADRMMASVQRIAYRASRAMRLHEADETAAFDPTLPPGMNTAINMIPVTAQYGGGWAPVTYWVPKPLLQQAIDAAAAAVVSANAAAASAANSAAQAIAAAGSVVTANVQASAAIQAASDAQTAAGVATAMAAAASTSASNAATSATNASTSEANALTYKNSAATSALNASGSATSASTSATNASNSETNAANSATAAANSAAQAAQAGSAPTVFGAYNSPQPQVAATSIAFSSTTYANLKFVSGNGGPQNMSANPQIQPGTLVGQRLILYGTSDTNTITLNSNANLKLKGQGQVVLFADVAIEFLWNGNIWAEL